MAHHDKLNRLFQLQPMGAVLLSSWLRQQGYSYPLQHQYKLNKWLAPLGVGAYIRSGDRASLEGAIYALQQQTGLSIHPAATTAFSLQGSDPYILFGSAKERLPAWFTKNDWGVSIEFHPTSFLDPRIDLTTIEANGFKLTVSNPARALMECLYLAPEQQDLIECYKLMEGLNFLQHEEVQALMESCRSVKVNRLFIYLADKAGHEWANNINFQYVDLGNGKRSIAGSGVYMNEYGITVPKELGEDPTRLLEKAMTRKDWED